jgi:hypothetical protein
MANKLDDISEILFQTDIYQISDTLRDNKIITPPQLPVIAPYFDLEIAWFSIADTIFITILQKREIRSDRLSLR